MNTTNLLLSDQVQMQQQQQAQSPFSQYISTLQPHFDHNRLRLQVAQAMVAVPTRPSESPFSAIVRSMYPDHVPFRASRQSWHLDSHKLFRRAIRKQLAVFLSNAQLATVKNKLISIGFNEEKFLKAVETKMYHEARCLEEYLEYTTLQKRFHDQLRKTRKIIIR
jgi:hypothetical protein